MVLFDTNILIDYLHEDAVVMACIDGYRKQLAVHDLSWHMSISSITVVELFSSTGFQEGDEVAIEKLLQGIRVVNLGTEIAERAGWWRREGGLKLGDAIIAASCESCKAILVTRDQKMAKAARKHGLEVEIP